MERSVHPRELLLRAGNRRAGLLLAAGKLRELFGDAGFGTAVPIKTRDQARDVA
jgi:hypothetical protein